jgi:protein-tyrosine phosphatase
MTPQALNIHTGFNFRDLGGYRAADGRVVASHRLIRAASLDHLDATDSTYLTDYGMRHVVDFRSREEKNTSPDRIPEGVTYLFDPVFSTDETLTSQAPESLAANFSTDPDEGRAHLTQTYADLVRQPSAQQAFRAFFDVALGNAGLPATTALFNPTASFNLTAPFCFTAPWARTAQAWQPFSCSRHSA